MAHNFTVYFTFTALTGLFFNCNRQLVSAKLLWKPCKLPAEYQTAEKQSEPLGGEHGAAISS